MSRAGMPQGHPAIVEPCLSRMKLLFQDDVYDDKEPQLRYSFRKEQHTRMRKLRRGEYCVGLTKRVQNRVRATKPGMQNK